MKTFIKQIEDTCKNYFYFRVLRTMQIREDYENSKLAIVSIRETEESERYYTIFYKYNTMKKVDHVGYYVSIYDKNKKLIRNAYTEACEEFAKYAN